MVLTILLVLDCLAKCCLGKWFKIDYNIYIYTFFICVALWEAWISQLYFSLLSSSPPSVLVDAVSGRSSDQLCVRLLLWVYDRDDDDVMWEERQGGGGGRRGGGGGETAAVRLGERGRERERTHACGGDFVWRWKKATEKKSSSSSSSRTDCIHWLRQDVYAMLCLPGEEHFHKPLCCCWTVVNETSTAVAASSRVPPETIRIPSVTFVSVVASRRVCQSHAFIRVMESYGFLHGSEWRTSL